MSTFEVFVLIGLGLLILALMGLATAVEKANRHLSNIANRLLDIEKVLQGRR